MTASKRGVLLLCSMGFLLCGLGGGGGHPVGFGLRAAAAPQAVGGGGGVEKSPPMSIQVKGNGLRAHLRLTAPGGEQRTPPCLTLRAGRAAVPMVGPWWWDPYGCVGAPIAVLVFLWLWRCPHGHVGVPTAMTGSPWLH